MFPSHPILIQCDFSTQCSIRIWINSEEIKKAKCMSRIISCSWIVIFKWKIRPQSIKEHLHSPFGHYCTSFSDILLPQVSSYHCILKNLPNMHSGPLRLPYEHLYKLRRCNCFHLLIFVGLLFKRGLHYIYKFYKM